MPIQNIKEDQKIIDNGNPIIITAHDRILCLRGTS